MDSHVSDKNDFSFSKNIDQNEAYGALLETEKKGLEKTMNGWNALHIACSKGDVELVQKLLAEGSRRDEKTEKGWTGLHISSGKGHIDVVHTLLKSGARVDEKNSNGWTSLHIACSKGHTNVLQALLKTTTKVDATGVNDWTPLHISSEQGFVEAVELLIGAGAKVNKKDSSGCTSLHIACAKGFDGIVDSLLRAGAVFDLKNNDGWTPLIIAASNNRVSVVRKLLAAGARIDEKAANGWTALHAACANNQLDVIHTLFEAGAKIDEKTLNGWTALYIASGKGHLEVIRLLLHAGAVIEEKTVNDWTALHIACSKGHVAVVYELLKAGARVHAKNANGWTALHIACLNNHLEVVKTLLREGAMIDEKASNRWTALHVACEKGHAEVVQTLISEGANLEEKITRGRTAVHVACCYGHIDVVRLLLQAGAKIDTKEDNGGTLLHIACANGHKEIVQAVIEAGANVEEKTIDGWTALDIADEEGHDEVVRTLLLAGATFENSTMSANYVGVSSLGRLMFVPVKKNISVAMVHICGKQTAGKSVVSYWISDILQNRFSTMFSVLDSSHVIDLTLERTRGIETRCISSEGGKKLLYLHDYGGHPEFQINHASNLASANSAYVIVVPWWNFDDDGSSPGSKRPRVHSYDEMESLLMHWLRFIYSTKRKMRQKTSSSDEEVHDVPVMIVINVFQKFTNVSPDGMEAKNRATKLLQSIQRVFDADEPDWIHASDGFRFIFLGPICIDAERKWQSKQLIQPLMQCYDMISLTEVTLHSIVDFVLSKMRQDSSLSTVMRLEAFYAFVSAKMKEFANQQKKQWTDDDIDLLIKHHPKVVVKSLVRLGEVMVLHQSSDALRSDTMTEYHDGNEQEQSLVVTSPNWLTNTVFGEVLYELGKHRHGRDGLVVTEENLVSMMMRRNPSFIRSLSGVTLSGLLHQAGLCVPYKDDRFDQLESTSRYLLLGLIEESMPPDVGLWQGYDRCIGRFYTPANDRCMIIPGLYMRLFVFIRTLASSCKYARYWADGMHMVVDLPPLNSGNQVQYLVQPHSCGALSGFDVVVATSSKCVAGVSPEYAAFHEATAMAVRQLDVIRAYLQTSIFGVELREFSFHYAERDLLGLGDIYKDELAWFSHREEHRVNVFGRFMGCGVDGGGGGGGGGGAVSSSAVFVSLPVLISKAMRSDGLSLLYLLIRGDDTAETQPVVFDRSSLIKWVAQVLWNSPHDNADMLQTYIRKLILEALRDDRFVFNDCDRTMSVQDTVQEVLSICGMGVSPLEHGDDKTHVELPPVHSNPVNEDNKEEEEEEENAGVSKLVAIETHLSVLRRHLFDDSSDLFSLPILPVIAETQATGLYGRMRRTLGKMYRVRFLCVVCGNCGVAGLDHKGKGYKLPYVSRLTHERLLLFKKTLEIADLLLQVASVPLKVSVVAQCVLQTLSATTQQMVDAGLMRHEDIQAMQTRVQDTLRRDTTTRDTTTQDTSVVSSATPIAVRFGTFGPTYVHWIKCLLRAVGEEPGRDTLYCGLVPAVHEDTMKKAWVCRGDGLVDSKCYHAFRRNGLDSLLIRVVYG